MTHPLLDLQAAETLADQLRHRKAHLPEQQRVDTATAAMTAWQRRRVELEQQLLSLDQAVARSESESHTIDEHLARLEKQMKTIIAPREAEALQNEMARLKEQRGALDDAELEALEQQSQVDDELQAHLAGEAVVADELAAASDVAAAVTADIDRELVEIAGRLDDLRAAVDPAVLRRYDQLRTNHVVAAAALNGHRCEGCHLDLSAHEVDDVRDAAAGTGIADCPQCGRMLVL